jgi:hypothetical protein
VPTGVADPNSTPAKVGIIDATKVADYLNSATAAVDSLMNTNQPSTWLLCGLRRGFAGFYLLTI